MTNEDLHFLQEVQERARDPEMLEKIILAAVSGVEKEARDARKFGVDMETVARISLDARLYKSSKKHIADLLERNQGVAALDWTDEIEKLRSEE